MTGPILESNVALQNVHANNKIYNSTVAKADLTKQQTLQPDEFQQVRQNDTKIRDTLVLGVGSTAAYWLASKNHTAAQQSEGGGAQPFGDGKLTIVGDKDAWDTTVRGPGWVNHQHEIIDSNDESVAGFDKRYADRHSLASDNANKFRDAKGLGAELLQGRAKKIEAVADQPGVYAVTFENDNKILARNVIVATGAGNHTVVTDQAKSKAEADLAKTIGFNLGDHQELKSKVIDLDTFVTQAGWNPSKYEGKTIVVHGPNAGIDAAEVARRLGCNLVWLGRNSAPVILDGNQLQTAPKDAKDLKKVERVEIGATEAGDQLNVVTTPLASAENPAPAKETYKVDFYVYALGQDGFTGDAVGAILSKDLQARAKPIYDKNQVFSDKAYETVTGIAIPGADQNSGIQILGAAASSFSKVVKHTYLEDYVGSLDGVLLGHDKIDTKTGDTVHVSGLADDFPEVADQLRAALKEATKLCADTKLIGQDAYVDRFIAGRKHPNPEAAAQATVKDTADATAAYKADLAKAQSQLAKISSLVAFARDSVKSVSGTLNAEGSRYEADQKRHIEAALNGVKHAADAIEALQPKKQKDGSIQPSTNVSTALDKTTSNQVKSVLQAAQLGAAKAQISAIDSYIPSYISQDVNFTTDNRDQLRIFIALEYPDVDNAGATRFIDDVIDFRSSTSELAHHKAGRVLLDSINSGVPAKEGLSAEAFLQSFGLDQKAANEAVNATKSDDYLAFKALDANVRKESLDKLTKLERNKGKPIGDDYEDRAVRAYVNAARVIAEAFSSTANTEHENNATVETLRPVHGTPDGVRRQFRRELDALNSGGLTAGSERPAVQSWLSDLRERVAESKVTENAAEVPEVANTDKEQYGDIIYG